jgi:hypothetical protein
VQQFIAKFKDKLLGVVSGFDRLIFRGILRRLAYSRGMEEYLWQNRILFKDYSHHVKKISERVRKAAVAEFAQDKLPVLYLASPKADKDEIAQQIAAQRGIQQGPICALSTMEPSPTFEHRGKYMVARTRPCHVLYHYRIHPEWGWMSARIQTWFPFNIQVCLNGREWLARQMDRAGLNYQRQGNCFVWLEDYQQAQQWLDAQLETQWPAALQALADQLNPLHEEIFQKYPTTYYWTSYQSESATDLVFRPGELRRLEPLFLRHAMLGFSSPDVMRFLGHKVNLSGEIPAKFSAEVVSDLKRRQEGERIKHRLDKNSVKAYGKAHTSLGDVWRVETTINQARQLRAYRPKEGGPQNQLAWRPLRAGVADLYRRAELARKSNERYLDALSTVDDGQRLEELIRPLEQAAQWKGRRVRPLHPFAAPDSQLLTAVNRGEFVIQGFRNRDLQKLLYAQTTEDLLERRRRSAAVSRKLRLLRAHGLIYKIPKSHRYQVTSSGRVVVLALLAVQQISLAQLNRAAAA